MLSGFMLLRHLVQPAARISKSTPEVCSWPPLLAPFALSPSEAQVPMPCVGICEAHRHAGCLPIRFEHSGFWCFNYLQRQTASVYGVVVVSLIPCGAGNRIQGLVPIQQVLYRYAVCPLCSGVLWMPRQFKALDLWKRAANISRRKTWTGKWVPGFFWW